MNIFLLPPELADEDRFTAHLHYLIECVPAVGQAMVDTMLRLAGKPTSIFTKSEDHPGNDPQNKPDFVLQCDHFDIVCEHKLESPLGENQLERYLAMGWHRTRYLALITNTHCNVASDVLHHQQFLHPVDASHYLWRDLYSMLDPNTGRMVRDFAAYMRSLGMKPLELANGWALLFEDRVTAEAFGEQFRRIRDFFSRQGARCSIDASRRGFQIGRPVSWLHLLYVCVEPAGKTSLGLEDAVLTARIYLHTAAPEVEAFRGDGIVELAIGRHRVRACARDRIAPWNRELRLVFEYMAPLVPVLSDDAMSIQEALLEFANGVFEHCQLLVARQSMGRPK